MVVSSSFIKVPCPVRLFHSRASCTVVQVATWLSQYNLSWRHLLNVIGVGVVTSFLLIKMTSLCCSWLVAGVAGGREITLMAGFFSEIMYNVHTFVTGCLMSWMHWKCVKMFSIPCYYCFPHFFSQTVYCFSMIFGIKFSASPFSSLPLWLLTIYLMCAFKKFAASLLSGSLRCPTSLHLSWNLIWPSYPPYYQLVCRNGNFQWFRLSARQTPKRSFLSSLCSSL